MTSCGRSGREICACSRVSDWMILRIRVACGRFWVRSMPCSPLAIFDWSPSFEQPCLRFHAAARVRLIPLQLLFLILVFLLSPPVLRALLAK